MTKLPQFMYILFQETFMKGEQAEKKKVCKNMHTERYLPILYENCYGA